MRLACKPFATGPHLMSIRMNDTATSNASSTPLTRVASLRGTGTQDRPIERPPLASRRWWIVAGAVAAGLIALAVALVGPKRIERRVYRPLRDAVEPRAEKLWADTKPVREQIAELLENVSPSGRARLVSSLQSWIGRFTAH